MRNYFFGANWKMNMSLQDAKDFFSKWDSLSHSISQEVVIFPTQYTVSYIQDTYGIKNKIGVQNTTFYPKGAYTGEITAELLQKDGIKYALVGHSERREFFSETDSDIHKKIINNFKYELNTVLCIGESLDLREKGDYISFLQNQLRSALTNIECKNPHHLIIAYEPIWAIGTGKVPSIEQITQTHSILRQELYNMGYPSHDIRIIYGGSVNPDNAQSILAIEDVDGFLIGGASLTVESLQKIISA